MKSKLNRYMEFYNITQKELAEGTGINRNTIGRYCNDTFESIPKNHISLLCSFFKCSFDSLFEVDYDMPVKYPSMIVANSILTIPIPESLTVTTGIDESIGKKETITYIKPQKSETSQPDIQVIDSNGNINLYEVKISNSTKKPNRFSGRGALKIAKQFEEKHGYNPIPTDEEILEMELQQERLDLEHDVEVNVESIINSLVLIANENICPKNVKEEYYDLFQQKGIPVHLKFITTYRFLYNVVSSQIKDSSLSGLLTKLRNIYTHGGLLDLSDNELMNMFNITRHHMEELKSNNNIYNPNQKD